MLKFIILCLIPIYSFSQTDTLTNAKAYTTNYITTPIYGVANNGHIYGMGFSLNYAPVTAIAQEMDLVRIDYTSGTITRKTMVGSTSSTSAYWQYCMDSSYNIYVGLNSGNRVTWKINLKDSIVLQNLGGFTNGELAYSIGLGRDGNIYEGGSSGITSTSWLEINKTTGAITLHPPADPTQDYILSIQGDTLWAYLQIGQSGTITYVAIRKADNYKKVLASISSEGRFNTGTYPDGIYVQISGLWYRVTDTTLTQHTLPVTNPIVVHQVSDNVTWFDPNLPQIRNYFDEPTQNMYCRLNNVPDTIPIPVSTSPDNIRMVITDNTNPNVCYYVGDYYGAAYKHYMSNDSVVLLGKLGLNIYSWLQYNDSIYYFAGYPSGTLAMYNKNQAWTAQSFNVSTGNVNNISASTNPKLIGYFRTNTTAGFHHAQKLIKLSNGVIASGGDVIRTAESASIAFYDPATNQMWGFNQDSMNKQYFRDISAWGNNVIFTTSNSNGGTPKLFIYNTTLRTMTDSLNFGFHDYGFTYLIGDLLLGIAQDTANSTHQVDMVRFYKINLSTGQLVYNVLVRATLNATTWMPDGYIGINMTYTDGQIVPIPVAPPKYFSLTRTIAAQVYNYSNLTYLCPTGTSIVERSGITTYILNMETAQGKQRFLMELLK